jgi:hypothetical protein
MKSLIKPAAIAIFATSIGLSCTIAKAAEEQVTDFTKVKQQYVFLHIAPAIEDGGSGLSPTSWQEQVNKAPKLPVEQPQSHQSCQSTGHKNKLYELSAIFNDKLQMFLAYFNDSNEKYAEANSKDSMAESHTLSK